MATLIIHSSRPMSSHSTSWVGVGAIVVAVAVVELVSAIATRSGTMTYPVEPEPVWAPPGWVFGPVWSALYAIMAVAASLVWISRNKDDVCCPLTAFSIQLALNLTWSVFFFALQSPLLGFLSVCLLWVAVSVTVAQFFLVSRVAGWLMVPYWAWVTFAATLNGSMLLLRASP